MKFIQIFFIQIFLFFALLGRLIYLQCVDSTHFKKLSQNNHVHVRLIPSERGIIKDKNGVILAQNKPTYKGYIFAYDKRDFFETLSKIQKVVPFEEQPLYKRRSYVLVYPTMTWEQVALLESANIASLKIEETYKRHYEFDHNFFSVLGYVSISRETDEISFPGLYLGRGIGVEASYNDVLMGDAHAIKDEVDARGRFVQNLECEHGEKGAVLTTTLNADLQSHMISYLKSRADIKSAGIVVMKADTGAIEALISYPSPNPNLFVNQISSKTWGALQNNPYKPLYNKVLQGLYSPGSVFKMAVLLTAMEKKIELKNVFCSGHIDVKGVRRHCWAWKKGGHGVVNMDRALSESCDIYFYELAKKLSLHDVMNTAAKLGYGCKTKIDVTGEKKGKLLSFLECYREDPCNYFIGQGKLLATPLQLAQVMASLVNGGYRVTPHVVQSDALKKVHLGFNESDLAALCQSMKNTVLKGTAGQHAFYTKEGDLGMGGKTGTTQVCKIYTHERSKGQIDRAYHLKDHAFFAGFGPTSKPEYVIVVVIEHGGSGSVAAGVAKEAMQFLLHSSS